jgi:hypothetical protein
MKGFGIKVKRMVKDVILMERPVDQSMLEAGLLISSMDKEQKNGQMAQCLSVVFCKDKNTEKETLLGLMGVAIQVISTGIKSMEWDLTYGAIKEDMKVNG